MTIHVGSLVQLIDPQPSDYYLKGQYGIVISMHDEYEYHYTDVRMFHIFYGVLSHRHVSCYSHRFQEVL